MEHWANASDPQIPAALAPVVKGIVSLNNFPRRSLSHRLGAVARDPQSGAMRPQFTIPNGSSDVYGLGPGDFATIYNTAPLLLAGTDGSGQSIAIPGMSNVNLQDVSDFRAFFGLGTGKTSVILDGADPGIVEGDETESLLDLEWSNAVAPGASVLLVSAQNTATTSGLDLATLHIVDNNLAGALSVSYGICEAALGNAGNAFVQSMYEQAAAQGITVIVAAGDDGSGGCDDMNTEYVATNGLAVNALAATPYNVAVGGTDFDDAGNASQYWNSTNTASFASAKSYIPETMWNQSCAATASAGSLGVCPAEPSTGTPPASLNLWAGSGGASNCALSSTTNGKQMCAAGVPKPAWQSGKGVPGDSVRDLPDVSLFSSAGSSSNSFYVVCEADAVPVGYTSCQKTGILSLVCTWALDLPAKVA